LGNDNKLFGSLLFYQFTVVLIMKQRACNSQGKLAIPHMRASR
jgi:hypothetical protein